MKESIGQATPESRADNDHNGVADEAEREFAETSQVQPSPSETRPVPERKAAIEGDDEALLESARKSSTSGAPGTSN